MINKKAFILSFLFLLIGVIVLYINPELDWFRFVFFVLIGFSVSAFLYAFGIGQIRKSKKDKKEEDFSSPSSRK
jgi:uncharacterized membrane protein